MEQTKKLEEHIKVIDLINYQKDSIVSRTILDKETGSVTLFAFDEGQGLSEHKTPFDALIQILDGEAEVMVSYQRFHPIAGEIIMIPANQPHALRANKPFKMILTMIKS